MEFDFQFISTVYPFLSSTKNFILINPVLTSGACAGCIALWGILTQRRLSREKNSIDFETQISSSKDYRAAIRATLMMSSSEIEAAIKDKNTDQNFVKITNVLNTWERCARSVHSNLYDDNYLYKVFGSTVIGLYRTHLIFIESRQETNPRFYIQFTAMASHWMVRRYKEEKNGDLSEKLKEILALKREQKFYTDDKNITKAKHKGHAKQFEKQVIALKKLIK
jgi:hypothetical protein